MKHFSGEGDLGRRRAMIAAARHRGSVPPDVGRQLCKAIERDELSWHEDGVAAVNADSEGLTVQLKSGALLRVQRVLLATGFDSERPGGGFVAQLIESASLPCAGCGYPIVDSALRWHSRIHVTGPLAELELGPVAKNIAGARRAGERIIRAARASRPSSLATRTPQGVMHVPRGQANA